MARALSSRICFSGRKHSWWRRIRFELRSIRTEWLFRRCIRSETAPPFMVARYRGAILYRMAVSANAPATQEGVLGMCRPSSDFLRVECLRNADERGWGLLFSFYSVVGAYGGRRTRLDRSF